MRLPVLVMVSALLFGASAAGAAGRDPVQDWVQAQAATLAAASSVAATRAGPVEYIRRGTGPVVLCMHGAPGGFDQSLLICGDLVARGYTVIGVSRPGSLRTPLSTGSTAEAQADAVIALLDALGIPQAAILGFSAGSIVAFQAAVRHPQRVWALVMEGVGAQTADTPSYDLLRLVLGDRDVIAAGDAAAWALYQANRLDPAAMPAQVLPEDTALPPAELAQRIAFVQQTPAQLAFNSAFVDTLFPPSLRIAGFLNDIRTNDAIDPWDIYIAMGQLQGLQVPTAVVQAVADSNGNYGEAQKIAARIPGARLISVGFSGHFVWLGPQTDLWQAELAAFLRTAVQCAPPCMSPGWRP